ncbi:MHF histone-fold complex component [Vermiconidia calcicola]|uniref:MHF histone-fold complex component n=1 Tax=Vermiconidia calcicola TaxID=1690605 RepID=A0ACC3MMG2_9PEZI|nr:MHF histone-fold complex component [Vermiconidia calcicola]
MPGLQDADDATKEEKLKAALWYAIGQTVDGVALTQDLNATPHFIGGLSELVWAQIENVAQDLEAFAKHSDRQVINTKDVLLLGRRNEGLAQILKSQTNAVREKEKTSTGR